MASGNRCREICEPYEYGNLQSVTLGLAMNWGLSRFSYLYARLQLVSYQRRRVNLGKTQPSLCLT